MIEHPRADGESDGWVSYEVIEISTTVLRPEDNLLNRKKVQSKIGLLRDICYKWYWSYTRYHSRLARRVSYTKK